jgi:hypothetical protein
VNGLVCSNPEEYAIVRQHLSRDPVIGLAIGQQWHEIARGSELWVAGRICAWTRMRAGCNAETAHISLGSHVNFFDCRYVTMKTRHSSPDSRI